MVLVGNPRVVKSIGTVKVKFWDITIKSTNCVKRLRLIIELELNWAHHIGSNTRNCK